MDRISDNGKKAPLLVLGELSAVLPGASSCKPANLPLSNINDFYVVLALPIAERDDVLATLAGSGLLADQLVLCLRGDVPPRDPRWAGCGILENVDGETAEELRSRVLARVEGQRQKKLVTLLREAHDGGLARRLPETELARALDVTRLAHALACGYGLPPSAHARTLRAALELPAPTGAPWTGEPIPECLIPLAAAVLVDAILRGASCREVIRERAASLSFRARNDLFHQVDACLGSLPGGKHAA